MDEDENELDCDCVVAEQGMALIPVFSAPGFRKLVDYPIIVEMWDKKQHGRIRRAYQAQFDARERDIIHRWHTKFRVWHVGKGAPAKIQLRNMGTVVPLLQRAVHFFATI